MRSDIMKIYPGKDYDIKKNDIFNKLMIDTIKAKKAEFNFEGHQYIVYSDGICVQTLINDRVLYRILLNNI